MADTPNLGREFLIPFLVRDQARRAEQQHLARMLTPIAVDLKKHRDNLQAKYYSEEERTRRERENIQETARLRQALQETINSNNKYIAELNAATDLKEAQIRGTQPKISVEGTPQTGIRKEAVSPTGEVTITQLTEAIPTLTETQKALKPVVQQEINSLTDAITESKGVMGIFANVNVDSMEALKNIREQELIQLSTPGEELPQRFKKSIETDREYQEWLRLKKSEGYTNIVDSPETYQWYLSEASKLEK